MISDFHITGRVGTIVKTFKVLTPLLTSAGYPPQLLQATPLSLLFSRPLMYRVWGIEMHIVSGDNQPMPHLKQDNSTFASHCLVMGVLSRFGPSCWVTGSWETEARSSPKGT